jgi:hypothetical protein
VLKFGAAQCRVALRGKFWHVGVRTKFSIVHYGLSGACIIVVRAVCTCIIMAHVVCVVLTEHSGIFLVHTQCGYMMSCDCLVNGACGLIVRGGGIINFGVVQHVE